MSRLAIIELDKSELKFSAGHFMIFSDQHRESMHGHDYQVSVAFYAMIQRNGMSFDCRDYKEKLRELCKALDYHFILPSKSDFLTLTETTDQWIAHVGQCDIPFYKQDAVVLPICNATLEELSFWFLDRLREMTHDTHGIQGLVVRVHNGRGESGASIWGVTST